MRRDQRGLCGSTASIGAEERLGEGARSCGEGAWEHGRLGEEIRAQGVKCGARGPAFAKASAFAHGYGVTSRRGKHVESGKMRCHCEESICSLYALWMTKQSQLY